jgi:hypothetical protein
MISIHRFYGKENPTDICGEDKFFLVIVEG